MWEIIKTRQNKTVAGHEIKSVRNEYRLIIVCSIQLSRRTNTSYRWKLQIHLYISLQITTICYQYRILTPDSILYRNVSETFISPCPPVKRT
jgi:hypothetical protein